MTNEDPWKAYRRAVAMSIGATIVGALMLSGLFAFLDWYDDAHRTCWTQTTVCIGDDAHRTCSLETYRSAMCFEMRKADAGR